MKFKIGDRVLYNDDEYLIIHYEKDKDLYVIKNRDDLSSIGKRVAEEELTLYNKKSDIFSHYSKKMIFLFLALTLAISSGFMTISGYMNFFSSNKEVIGIIFCLFELTKFIIMSLIISDNKFPLMIKGVLFLVIGALLLLSIGGHYSFLSKAYFDDKKNFEIMETNKNNKKEIIKLLEEENKRLKKSIEDVPSDYISRKSKKEQELNPKIEENNKKIIELKSFEEVNENKSVLKINSMFFTAKELKIDIDYLAKIVITILSLLIDFLALVFAWIYGYNKREKLNF